jgi:hypothetical protein
LYPRLANATPEQRAHWEIAGAGQGIHWPEIDEDLRTGRSVAWYSGVARVGGVAVPFVASERTDER